MRNLILCMPAILLACSPADAVLGDTKLDDASGLGGTGGGDDGAGDAGDDGGDPGEPEPEPAVQLEAGDWVATAASTEDDPCDWNEVIQEYSGIDVLTLLPSEFEVESEEGRFEIEAQDYGAAGFIECEVDADDRFTCEAQRVTPLAYDLGSYGWTYQIDFSGTVEDERTLRGEAVVAYPSVDRGTADTLDYYGVDLADCTQTYSLVLELD